MKRFRTLFGIALLILPLAVWAQDTSPEPPPNPGKVPAGALVAGQTQPSPPPPPQGVFIQRRVVSTGGPEGPVLHLSTGGPEGMGSFPLGIPGLEGGLGAWWKNSEVVSKLALSEAQVAKIQQTFLDHKLKLIDLQADLEKQELRLQPLLDADQPDEGKVGTQIDLITAARGKLEKENAMMMLAIRSQLTVEQWKKLKSLQADELSKHDVLYWRGNPLPGGKMLNIPPLPPPGEGPVTAPGPPQ